jgi:hypothetical protein
MGLVRGICLLGMVLLAAALPALAVEATLVADVHVNSALPTVNSGLISNLNVGGGYTALLRFDLSTLPAGTTGAQVARAVLRLYCNRADVPGQVSVQAVSAGWDESSVTYATLPAVGGTAQVVSVGAAGAYVTVDVTALVQGWIAGSMTNNGVAMTSATAEVQFDSKENDLTGHAAVLDVELASTGPVGPAGSAGPTGPAGPAGPMGQTGPAGNAGATGAAGSPGLLNRGTYSSLVSYALGDVVFWQGSSYSSLLAGNLGNTPNPDSVLWGVLASQGAAGAAGPQGPTGLQGPSGLNGTPGMTGPQGAPGPMGATGSQGTVGPQGIPGPAGVRYRGAWEADVAYQPDDAALFRGTTYLATGASTSMEPDMSPAVWAVLAQAGTMGPTGPAGAAASVSVGSVTTVAAGMPAAVTNSGSESAAVLNFAIPQGAAGTSGGGSGTVANGISFGSAYHDVSFSNVYYAVNSTSESPNESGDVLTWVPAGCTATQLSVFSQQMNKISVTLRQGTPGNMADTAMVCMAGPASTCTAMGSVVVPAGNFVDLAVAGASGTIAGGWMALMCN